MNEEAMLKRAMTLLELSKADPSELKDVFRIFTEKTCEVLGVDRVSIWLFNTDRSGILCEDLYLSAEQDHTNGSILKVEDFPAYFSALETSRYIATADSATDPRTSAFTTKYLIPNKIVSMLDIPIRFEGNPIGVLCCEVHRMRREWNETEHDFACSVSEILSTLLHAHHRRRIEHALKKSEEKYRKMVDNASIGIFRCSLTGEFLLINPAMLGLFDIARMEDATGLKVSDLFDKKETWENFLVLILGQRILQNYETVIITRTGKHKSFIINAFLEEDSIWGMILDITERKRYEEEIKSAQIKAEESDRLKTSLLANMSHEFRTPMNAILGFADLIINETTDESLEFFARKIHQSGQRLMSTLKSILDLADLEATRSKVKITDVNIGLAVSATVQTYLPAATQKKISLINKCNEDIQVKADETLLQVIIQNLVDNAVKFTLSGSIVIDINLVEEKGIPWCCLRVSDTGIGIPDDCFDVIFLEFRQLSEGYNRSYEGNGLGLTLARKMAGMIGGRITVESIVGSGSTFTVWLPFSGQGVATSPAAVPSPAEQSFKSRIPRSDREVLPPLLIVEDNDDNAEIIKLYLKGKFLTDRASDSNSAIRMVTEKQFSGILMDINLGPGMDGLKATGEIRKLKNYRNVPIIAITGYTMSGDRERLLAGGCSHYLGKPFSQQELLEVMSDIYNLFGN